MCLVSGVPHDHFEHNFITSLLRGTLRTTLSIGFDTLKPELDRFLDQY